MKRRINMDKDFINEINLEDVVKYDKPFVVTFVALPGSLKTTVARNLSKDLKIYLLSNDYIRNYYYQFTKDYSDEKRIEIDKKVRQIQDERINYLVKENVSFVLDQCLNSCEDYEKLKDKVGSGYRIYVVKINNDDETNIKNISNIKMDYNHVYEGVIGDNVEYLSSFPKDVYYQIKERKKITISDNQVDFIISDVSNIEALEKDILQK